MKLKKEVFLSVFSEKEVKVIDMFEFINKELGNKNYELSPVNFKYLVDYFKTEDISLLETIWTDKSLEKDIFLFCYKFCTFIEDTPYPSKEYLTLFIQKELSSSPLKNIFLTLKNEIYSFSRTNYENSFNDKNNFFLYQDNFFEIYYFKNRKSIFETKQLSWGDMYFFIFLDGLILFNDEILGEQNLFFTKKYSHLNEFTLLTPTYSQILIVIKESYLNYNNLEIPDIDFKIIELCDIKVLKDSIKKNILSEKNNFFVIQILNYLIEKVKMDNLRFPYTEYINYKKEILKFFNDDNILNKEEIVLLLLQRLKVSLTVLYRIFDVLFKTTPYKYIENLKIEKSYILLNDTDDSIETIAEYFGYTRKIFSQKFFEKTGYTPSQFRSIIKE